MNRSSEDLKKQAEEILKLAKDKDVESNFYFTTTFERYLSQIELVARLEKELEESKLVLQKVYVKGTVNEYCNPIINAYNNTVSGANKTVTTLIKIMNSFKKEVDLNDDPLMKLINGDDDY